MHRELEETYGDRVTFLYVQTVFEGAWSNTESSGRADLEEFGVAGVFAHDPEMGDRRPLFMERYRTRGTPWTLVLDRSGDVLLSGFTRDTPSVAMAIDRALSR